jgi:sulfur transfer protein SufE
LRNEISLLKPEIENKFSSLREFEENYDKLMEILSQKPEMQEEMFDNLLFNCYFFKEKKLNF